MPRGRREKDNSYFRNVPLMFEFRRGSMTVDADDELIIQLGGIYTSSRSVYHFFTRIVVEATTEPFAE
jgi:hypothetical protein